MEGGRSPGLKKSQSWTSELGISPFHWCCGNGPSYLSLTVASSRCYCLSPLHISVSISPHSLPNLQSLLLKYFRARKVSSYPVDCSNVTANIWTQRKLCVGPFKYQTQVSCSWALSVKTHSSTEGSPGTCKISLKRSMWTPFSLCTRPGTFSGPGNFPTKQPGLYFQASVAMLLSSCAF